MGEATKLMLQTECGCIVELVMADSPRDLRWILVIACPDHKPVQ